MADQVPSMSQNTNGNAHILQPQARSARPLVLGSPPALGLGAAPAIDIESTDGSGNGSPVGGPIVSAPMGRLDSTRSWTGFLSPDPNAMDQHNHAPSTSPSIYAEIHLGPSSRPPPPRILTDGANDASSPVPSAVRSIAGFTGVHAAAAENVPVLVEYSALLRSTLGKQCPRRLLVIDLSQADALDTMIAKIRAHILEPTFRANEREIVVQRANHMKLEVAWVPGLDIGHGLIHDDDTLRRNLAVILRRGSKDYFVVKVQEPFGELDELEASEENQKEIDNEDEEPMGKDKALRRNTQGATSTERMTLGDGLVVVN